MSPQTKARIETIENHFITRLTNWIIKLLLIGWIAWSVNTGLDKQDSMETTQIGVIHNQSRIISVQESQSEIIRSNEIRSRFNLQCIQDLKKTIRAK